MLDCAGELLQHSPLGPIFWYPQGTKLLDQGAEPGDTVARGRCGSAVYFGCWLRPCSRLSHPGSDRRGCDTPICVANSLKQLLSLFTRSATKLRRLAESNVARLERGKEHGIRAYAELTGQPARICADQTGSSAQPACANQFGHWSSAATRSAWFKPT